MTVVLGNDERKQQATRLQPLYVIHVWQSIYSPRPSQVGLNTSRDSARQPGQS
jgi:hypothetical protein